MTSLKTSSFGNAIRRGSLKNTLLALYKFRVGETIHISYESIFGGSGEFLEAGTIQMLRQTSITNTQLKVVLSGDKGHPSTVKGAMQAFLPKINELMASLRNASKAPIQIYERPVFQWTSVLEEPKKNGTPVVWKDSTLSFQLVQTLVNLALAGNANEATKNLKIEDNKGPDVFKQAFKLLLTAAGILKYCSQELLPRWRSASSPGALECSAAMLDALVIMLQAQAQQVHICLLLLPTTVEGPAQAPANIASLCFGVDKLYQQCCSKLLSAPEVGLHKRVCRSLWAHMNNMGRLASAVGTAIIADAEAAARRYGPAMAYTKHALQLIAACKTNVLEAARVPFEMFWQQTDTARQSIQALCTQPVPTFSQLQPPAAVILASVKPLVYNPPVTTGNYSFLRKKLQSKLKKQLPPQLQQRLALPMSTPTSTPNMLSQPGISNSRMRQSLPNKSHNFHPPVPNGLTSFQIIVPQNLQPGQPLRVKAPNGQTMDITVPPGVQPGQRLRLQTPSVTSTNTFSVRVPNNVSANGMLLVTAPNGTKVKVKVPPGIRPGQNFMVKLAT